MTGNNRIISLKQVAAIGIPITGIPEQVPVREGHELAAVVSTDRNTKFAVTITTASVYDAYRAHTRHKGDRGSWIFSKMKLYFIPESAFVDATATVAAAS